MKAKKFLCVMMSIVLVLGLSPTTALAEVATNGAADDAENTASQIEGTAGVDYVEGEVLVAVRGGVSALEAETSTSTLAQFFGASSNEAGSSSFTIGESLSNVSVNDIAAAAEDVGATDEVNLAAGSGDASLASADADDVEIILLECDDVAQTIADLKKLDCVVVAQPNYCYSLVDDEESAEEVAAAVTSAVQDSTTATSASVDADATASLASAAITAGTSEPFYSAQWSLQNNASLKDSGYTGTTSMDVEDAWNAGAGNEEGGDVVVAVIDSGVDYTHEDLAENMWTGGEADWSTALGGGKYGMSAATGSASNDPLDVSVGHGTHVASTIAAAWNNTGIAGVNNKVDIMAIRLLPGGSANSIQAYNYVITAKENGVNVVAANNSWGPSYNTSSRDTLLDAMIYKAGTKGVISVFSAGNSAYDDDLVAGHHYNNSNPYILTVGALNSNSESLIFSDRGKLSVDVFSPGAQVLAATTSYGAQTGASVQMNAEYLPWLSGSAGSNSTYFIDDASSLSRKDGITFSLVGYDEFRNLYPIDGGVSILDGKGYPNAGTNNNKSLKFSLKAVQQTVDSGLSPAIRITIPAATWDSYKKQNNGDDLYFSAIGAFSDTGFIDPYLKTCIKTNTEWTKLAGAINGNWDYSWYVLANKMSLSEIDNGRDENGDVTILVEINGLEKTEKVGEITLGDDDYVYLDNVSLGWAAVSGSGTKDANDSYYYCDGTSMAAPNTTGVVSLLCSHAAAKSDDDNYLQSGETAREIVSFVKGGVTQLDSLSNKCSTGGATNADVSYEAYKAYKDATDEAGQLAATASLQPVPDSIKDNGGGTCTLSGNFFGAEQGTVTFKGEKLAVKNWSDTAITFESLSYSKEQVGEVIVTKANTDDAGEAITGQSYLILPAGSNSAQSFDTLPTPDFALSLTTTSGSGVVATIEANAGDVTPWSMVAADGYVYVYGTLMSTEPVLMRYDIAAGTWDEKNFLGEYASHIHAKDSKLYISMAAGKSEIYIRYPNSETNKYNLMTLDAKTGTVKYDVAIGLDTNSRGSLGFLNGKLYVVGGEQGEPVCAAIYPNTGASYWISETKLPVNALSGYVTSNGFGFEITGSFSSIRADDSGFQAGARNEQINIYMPNERETMCSVSESGFFPQEGTLSAYDLDAGQPFATMGAAAVDGAVIVTGPVRYNESENMVDTWIYNAQTGEWTAVLGSRFAPTAEYAICSCTYDGSYYVMATDLQQEGVTQRFRCISIDTWGLTDELIAAKADALCDTSGDEKKKPEPKTKSAPVYRLYNPSTGEHLYTPDVNEYNTIPADGWLQEGVAWYAPETGRAVYRLYNSRLNLHVYSSDSVEIEHLRKSAGWEFDNGGKPVFYSAESSDSVGIYRLYRAADGNHLLTSDMNEVNVLTTFAGWTYDGDDATGGHHPALYAAKIA